MCCSWQIVVCCCITSRNQKLTFPSELACLHWNNHYRHNVQYMSVYGHARAMVIFLIYWQVFFPFSNNLISAKGICKKILLSVKTQKMHQLRRKLAKKNIYKSFCCVVCFFGSGGNTNDSSPLSPSSPVSFTVLSSGRNLQTFANF